VAVRSDVGLREEAATRFRLVRVLVVGGVGALLALTGMSAGAAPVWKDPRPFLPLFITYVGVGLVIVLRRRANRIGWLLVGLGVLPLLGWAALLYAEWALPDRPGVLVDLARWLAAWCMPVGIAASVLLLLLFPDGRLPGPRWRWAFAVATTGIFAVFVRSAFGAAQGTAESLGNPYELQTLRSLLAVLEVLGPAML
jgi:hypothetical protein